MPDVAIFTKAKRMVVPTRAEGFDEVNAVSIRDDGTFEVRPIGSDGRIQTPAVE